LQILEGKVNDWPRITKEEKAANRTGHGSCKFHAIA
jgi:hypothetical protein